MNNTEYPKEEFKKAVLAVRPDATFNERNIHGDVDVVLPETKGSKTPLVAFFINNINDDQYAVWNHAWRYHATLDAFMVDFKNRYGKDEPKKTDEPVKGKHYDGIVETIKLIEEVVSREALPRTSAYCIGNALKYIMRCSVKPGTDWKDDIKKAENYLHRALTGEWIA